MEKLQEQKHKITVPVLEIPVLTWFGVKYEYSLSDFSYGEWIGFVNGKPKYYVNAFDDYYRDLRERREIVRYLVNRFRKDQIEIKFDHQFFGYRLDKKAKTVRLELERVPLKYFSSDPS